eukprot:SAG31_NODE_13868_length_841_cov_1.134771_1_plen_280_part_11
MILTEDNTVESLVDGDDGSNQARQAGISVGQRIIEANGQRVDTQDALRLVVSKVPSKGEVELIVQEASAVTAGGGRMAYNRDTFQNRRFAGLRRKSIALVNSHHNNAAMQAKDAREDTQARRTVATNAMELSTFEVGQTHLTNKSAPKLVTMMVSDTEICFLATKNRQILQKIDFRKIRRWLKPKDNGKKYRPFIIELVSNGLSLSPSLPVICAPARDSPRLGVPAAAAVVVAAVVIVAAVAIVAAGEQRAVAVGIVAAAAGGQLFWLCVRLRLRHQLRL